MLCKTKSGALFNRAALIQSTAVHIFLRKKRISNTSYEARQLDCYYRLDMFDEKEKFFFGNRLVLYDATENNRNQDSMSPLERERERERERLISVGEAFLLTA